MLLVGILNFSLSSSFFDSIKLIKLFNGTSSSAILSLKACFSLNFSDNKFMILSKLDSVSLF